MNNIFSRTAALLGNDALEKLQSSRVAVFGAGGVGSYVIEALCRSGVGNIDIFDNDVIEPSNINRQIMALMSNVGLSKAEECVKRAKAINPDINANAFNMFYCGDNADTAELKSYDFIVDAIDSVSSKVELIVRASAAGVPIISCMGTGNKLDPTRIRISDIYKTSVCPLARVMRAELKKRGIKKLPVAWSDEIPVRISSGDNKADGKAAPASAVFVPAAAGLAIAAYVTKELTEKD